MRQLSKITYRPEIDGLRAISVLSVIIFHFEIEIFDQNLFPGGFLGVDIFFVISGYLITSIILKEYRTFSKFSFSNFYQRRVRRILPLLVLVTSISFPFAYKFLLPSDLIEFSKSAIYSLGFSSNFYFHYSGKGYGAEVSNLLPLLHTWSLSVEEQFYIIFPIFFYILYKFLRNYIIHIFIFGFILSLILAQWATFTHPHFNFYFLPTRGWEILAGSIIAYLDQNKFNKRIKINEILNSFLLYLGITIIFLSFIFFPNTNGRILGSYHPSFLTLFPVLGSCLIIWFANQKNFIIKILSSSYFVFVGLISYSLYLWHFPIYSFANYLDLLNSNNIEKIFLILITFLFAMLSYFFVEKPARNKKFQFRYLFTILFLFYFFISLTSFLTITNKGFTEKRLPKIISDNISLSKILKNDEGNICEDNDVPCVFNSNSPKKVILVGDSLAGSIAFDLKKKILKNNYQFITVMRGGCLIFPGFDRFDISSNLMSNGCDSEYFEKVINFLNSQSNSIIIIVGRYPLYFNEKNFDNNEGGVEPGGGEYRFIKDGNFNSIQESFKSTILKLSNKNKIILVYPVPEVGWHVPRKLNSVLLFKSQKEIDNYLIEKNYLTTSYEVFKLRNNLSFEVLDSIKNNNIHRVYPHKIFCNSKIKNRCITHDNQNIFYYDYIHLLGKGSMSLVSLIINKIKSL